MIGKKNPPKPVKTRRDQKKPAGKLETDKFGLKLQIIMAFVSDCNGVCLNVLVLGTRRGIFPFVLKYEEFPGQAVSSSADGWSVAGYRQIDDVTQLK